jgi:hypothetical protein
MICLGWVTLIGWNEKMCENCKKLNEKQKKTMKSLSTVQVVRSSKKQEPIFRVVFTVATNLTSDNRVTRLSELGDLL